MMFWCHDQDLFCATWWTESVILDVERKAIPENEEIQWALNGKREIW